jgi:hypothetical protein
VYEIDETVKLLNQLIAKIRVLKMVQNQTDLRSKTKVVTTGDVRSFGRTSVKENSENYASVAGTLCPSPSQLEIRNPLYNV